MKTQDKRRTSAVKKKNERLSSDTEVREHTEKINGYQTDVKCE